MAISMDRLYARNIPQIQNFLTQNNQELCSFLQEMDSAEEAAQLEEGDYDQKMKKWGTVAYIGGAVLTCGLYAYGYKNACTSYKDNGESYPSMHKYINEGGMYGSAAGFMGALFVRGVFLLKAHWAIEGRIEKKIDSIRLRIIEEKAKGSNAIEVELQQLDLSKKFFKKLMKQEDKGLENLSKPLIRTPT